MDVGRQQVPEGVVNEPVLRQAAQAIEAGGDDTNVEMPTTVPGASMPGVQMAFVRYFEQPRLEVCNQAAAYLRDPLCRICARHGMTWTKGLTITLVQTPAVT